MGHELYKSDNFQIQEVGVFLFGYAAHENADALSFLKNTVSQNDSWIVQEILAMAFDNHCKIIRYETALPIFHEWLDSDCANVRRAVSEGLRVWTSRPYFKDNPQAAMELLAAHKSDESAYVRKSIGNAIWDISKKYSKLVSAELSTWDCGTGRLERRHFVCEYPAQTVSEIIASQWKTALKRTDTAFGGDDSTAYKT